MRIVVVGAGVAGLTLAALLPRAGHQVTLLERRGGADAGGYALALWPHGTRVLQSIGMADLLPEIGEESRRYTLLGASGRMLASQPLPASITTRGLATIVDRAALLERMRRAAIDVESIVDARVVGVQIEHDHAEVELADGSRRAGDLVIGADGIGSAVRGATIGGARGVATGWTCLAWWVDREDVEQREGEIVERWGVGSFLGRYPVRERLCLIAGAPDRDLEPSRRSATLRRIVRDNGLDPDLAPADPGVLPPWPMADVRSPSWIAERTVLVGDAAAGFMPTAGIGASMALESAAALADELSRTDAAHVDHALALYQRRRRRRVESVQRDSRWLARTMFVGGRGVAAVRDRVLRHVPVATALSSIVSTLDEPI